MVAEPTVLFTVAELAVALAGFSAIVVLFKRRDSGKWVAGDADRFQGMVLHAMVAAVFCLLPSVLGVFTNEATQVWSIASLLLGIETVGHVAIVLRMASTTWTARGFLSIGFLVAAAQFANAAGVGFAREFPPYLLGVLWHVAQAGVLFVILIWVSPNDVEQQSS